MNNVSARNKKKRSRSSSSEGKNSFVQSVAARMTELLPATITKWFSSPTPSNANANGSTLAGDTTDSSSEDEGVDMNPRRPPVKRMRFSRNISPVQVPSYSHSEGTSTNDRWINQPLNSTNMAHSTPDAYAHKRGSIFSSTSKPTPNVMIDANPSLGDNVNNTTAPSSYRVSMSGPALQRKRKSLFDIANREDNLDISQAKSDVETRKHPTFRASMLGSPFYKGRTMYGGAGASYYLDEPNIQQRSLAVVNESTTRDDTMSGAARRVMDILESYSSPLTEARRIPSYTRSPNLHHSSDFASPSTSISQLQSIQVPSVGSFLNIKQRSRLMDSTSIARQIMASQTSTTDFMPYAQSNKRNKVDHSSSISSVSSIKPRLKTSSKKSDHWQEEIPPPVDLPSVALNIDQAELPKFSFGVSPAPSKSDRSAFAENTPPTSESSKLNIVDMEVTPQEDLVINSTFKFSSPIRILKDFTPTITTPPSVSPSFGTLSPLDKIDKISVIKASAKDDSKEWRCSDCWVNNKASIEKCICCGSKRPSAGVANKVSKCTKCNTLECEADSVICVACKKIDSALKDNFTANKASPSTWKCDSCWVSNNMSDEKCVCCAGPRVKDKANESVKLKPAESLGVMVDGKSSLFSSTSNSLTSIASSTASNTLPKGDMFKPIIIGSQTNQWECPSCLVRNDDSKLKCVCCETEKPGIVKESAIIIGSQTNQWKCPSCLVRNDNSKLKCVCCETEKPGTVKESDKKIFNFGISNTGFKFGIQSQSKDDNSKATENTVKLKVNSSETETNNNSLKTAPSFSFGIPCGGVSETVKDTQKDKENKHTPAAKVDTLSSKGFALGNTTDFFKMPSTPNTLLSQNAVLKGTDDTNQKDTEKEQEVPKAFAPIKLEQQTLTPSTYFGSFTNKQDSDKDVPISSATSVDKATENNTTVAASLSEPNKLTFTFPITSGEQKQTNSQIVPATTSSVSFNPLLTTPATTAAVLFSAEVKTTPSQIFQKVEPAPTTAQSTTSSLFSFGLNKPALPTNTTENAAKFNFSFGTAFASPFKANNDAANNALVPQQSAPVNTLASGTSLVPNSQPTTNNIFGSPVSAASDTMWMAPAPATVQHLGTNVGTNVPNIFSTSTPSNTLSKPAFNFGSPPFQVSNNAPTSMFNNSNQNTPAFGSPLNNNNAASTFGSTIKPTNNLPGTFAAPQLSVNSSPFGNVQSKSDMFGIQAQQVTNQQSLFMNKEAINSPFGGGVKASLGAGVFGAAASAAGVGPASMLSAAPAASAPALDTTPAPNFNFTTPGLFSFNQQQQPQHGVYSFGASPNVAPQVQFNMGSPGNIAPTPNTVVRKVRKAVRRQR